MRLFRRASAAIGLGSYAWRNRDRIGRFLSDVGDRLQSSHASEQERTHANRANQASGRRSATAR
ncbi:MAG: hypothetical protein S0880_31190 [Actinomycetota bacterium]|nr:hypothetical protein [Actinomycetota bacterium]